MKKIPLEIKNLCTVYAVVDDEDYEKVKDYNWQITYRSSNFYVFAHHRHGKKGSCGRRKRVTYYLHRLIMGLEKDSKLVVDHINGDGLDNRKQNLRVCTIAENARNSRRKQKGTSKYRGVYYDKWTKADKPFKASISINNKTTHIGRFKTAKAAALAYNKAALKHHGEFAYQNEVK